MADTTNSHLAHMVYFTLKDASSATQQALIDACHKYLKGHAGEVYFSAGSLVPDLARPVNDRAFHVSLHVVFESRKRKTTTRLTHVIFSSSKRTNRIGHKSECSIRTSAENAGRHQPLVTASSRFRITLATAAHAASS